MSENKQWPWGKQLTVAFCLPAPSPRYEEEINKRTTAENDFVVLKKVSWNELAAFLPVGGGPGLELCARSLCLCLCLSSLALSGIVVRKEVGNGKTDFRGDLKGSKRVRKSHLGCGFPCALMALEHIGWVAHRFLVVL